MFNVSKISISFFLIASTGCATSGKGPSVYSLCQDRDFEQWVSFYDLKDKANSEWPDGYGPAYQWLESVAYECYPDRFEGVEDGSEGNSDEGSEELDAAGGPSPEPEAGPEEGGVYEVPQDFLKVQAPDGPAIEKIK